MWKEFTYSEFKEVAKVGMRVRAVKGKHNPCGMLFDNGRNAGNITDVTLESFLINECSHLFTEDGYLQIYIEDQPRTLDELEEGDVITKDGFELTVFYIQKVQNGNHLVFTSTLYKPDEAGAFWTLSELKRDGYKLKQPEPPQVKEMTMEELNEERRRDGKAPVKIKE